MKTYKWDSPREWLSDVARDWNKASLYNALCCVAGEADSDIIQNIFQQEMDKSGYFNPIEAVEAQDETA